MNNVEANSPAERAGVKPGDVITTVNGKAIGSGDELVAIVSDTEVGKKLKVELLRDKKPMNVEIEVGDRTKIISRLRGGPEDEREGEQSAEEAGGVLGISARNLTREQGEELSEQLHLSGPQGVLVTDVKAGGFASDVGVQRGDVILSINHQAVRSASDVAAWQTKLKSGDDVRVAPAAELAVDA